MTNTNITTFENKLNQIESTLNTFTSSEATLNNKYNEMINSINQSLESLQGNIKTVENIVDLNEKTISSLESKVESAADNEGLIGGLNLAYNGSTNFGHNGISSSAYGFAGCSVNLEAGKTYTMTVCACSTQEAIDNGQYLATELFSSDWSIWHELEFRETTPTIKHVTFTIPKTQQYGIWNYAMPYKPNAKDVTVYWYNIQEGEVGTAWVPSLYDLKNILADKKEYGLK